MPSSPSSPGLRPDIAEVYAGNGQATDVADVYAGNGQASANPLAAPKLEVDCATAVGLAPARSRARMLRDAWAATSSKSMGENLDEWFKLRSQRSTVGREVLAGCVNYLVTRRRRRSARRSPRPCGPCRP